jgi:hypothetical protein
VPRSQHILHALVWIFCSYLLHILFFFSLSSVLSLFAQLIVLLGASLRLGLRAQPNTILGASYEPTNQNILLSRTLGYVLSAVALNYQHCRLAWFGG